MFNFRNVKWQSKALTFALFEICDLACFLRLWGRAGKEALLFATRTSRAYLPALLVLAEKQSHLCAERVKRVIKVVEPTHSESCAQRRDQNSLSTSNQQFTIAKCEKIVLTPRLTPLRSLRLRPTSLLIAVGFCTQQLRPKEKAPLRCFFFWSE